MVKVEAKAESGGAGPGGPSHLDADAVERAVAREAVRAGLFGGGRSPELGRYRLLRRLGRGGMGVVFLAHDPRLDRPVALKVLHERTHAGQAQERLLHEARSAARLAHPNVVTVYDAEIDEGRLFVAMEYVEGESLARWVEAPRPWEQSLRLLVQAGRGLAAAHAAGVVHRDFKPANVLVGRDGRARVADFGLATWNRSGAAGPAPAVVDPGSAPVQGTGLAGTLAYMAPEQLLSGISDARSDQYSFAVSLHEVLFGRRPFEAGSVPELVRAILERALDLPKEGPALPAALREALLRGLARAPTDRYADMHELVDAMESALPAGSGSARTADVPLAAPSGDLAAGAYPRCQQYLSAPAADLDRLRGHVMRASLIRLALASRPLGEGVPGAVREAVADPALAGEHIALLRARLILTAIFERHFGEVTGWRLFYRGLVRGDLIGGIRAFGAPSAGSAWVQRFLARSWNDGHPTEPMRVESLAPGRAQVTVAWPLVLRDELLTVEVGEHLRAGLELSGARFVELQEVEMTDDGLQGKLLWQ